MKGVSLHQSRAVNTFSMSQHQSALHLKILRSGPKHICYSKKKHFQLSCFCFNVQKDMIKPAVQGVINVLKSCLKSNSVKRVIYTSSAAAVSINSISEPGLVMTEENWSDVDFLTKEKPFNWVKTISCYTR